MPQSAWATTATAASSSPCSQFTPILGPTASRLIARITSSTADGSVKPSHAARAPGRPPRPKPSAMPTWLLAGPGRN